MIDIILLTIVDYLLPLVLFMSITHTQKKKKKKHTHTKKNCKKKILEKKTKTK